MKTLKCSHCNKEARQPFDLCDDCMAKEVKKGKCKTYQFVSDIAIVTITLDNNPCEDDAWAVLDEVVRSSNSFHLEEVIA